MPASLIRYQAPTGTAGPLFSFDDGPDPELTPRLLDALGAANVRAWFFLIGERASRHPEIVRRIASDGHLLGNHSWSHPAPRTLGTAAYLEDANRGRQQIAAITGSDVADFRPPHGFLTAGIALALWRTGNRIVMWNTDPKDYRMTDPGELSRSLSEIAPTTGDLVLLHDTSSATVSAFEAGMIPAAAR